ncbi:hypothetical protein R1T16_14015 [Flavobacterium sp. DG1-102-2]|uniref:hypothetical protein n=1 Tax=Flavobacterium sp. DG1-102-2 TaxID=3081663 RepID=UPI002949FA30|nr:hypothetical protein [Flavobacterium sp. DG1-102-2]MDV6169547.1 hypothetical protein [Flavobacterium sp. DG1-102-2]
MIQFVTPIDAGKLRMAYNNDILRFYSDSTDPALYADVTLSETSAILMVGTEPKTYFTIRLYPNPQGQFYLNLQPYVAATLNTRNFEDTLQTSLAAGNSSSFTYAFSNGTLLNGVLKINVTHKTAEADSVTNTLVWLGGTQQFGDYSRLATSDLLMLSPTKKNTVNEYYLKYWQGYPFDISVLDYNASLIARRNFTVVNQTNALTTTLSPKGNITRITFSDGRTDETPETLLPLAEGTNKLKVSTSATRQRWVHIEKVPYCEGVYLKWLNAMGGYSYWLFEDTYAIDRSTKYNDEIDRNNDNLENSFGRTVQTGKESRDTLKIIAELLTEDERRIVEGILDSPKIYLFTGKPLSQNSYRSWIEVTLKTGSARLKNPKQPLTNFTFDIELPIRFTQTL